MNSQNKDKHLKKGHIGIFIHIILLFISIIFDVLGFDSLAYIARIMLFPVFVFSFFHSYIFIKLGFKDIMKNKNNKSKN